MNRMAPDEFLGAVDKALEISSRWPRLLLTLGLQGIPGPASLNDALQRRGFGRAVDKRLDFVSLNGPRHPDAWWHAIATEFAGRADATVDEVMTKLRSLGAS